MIALVHSGAASPFTLRQFDVYMTVNWAFEYHIYSYEIATVVCHGNLLRLAIGDIRGAASSDQLSPRLIQSVFNVRMIARATPPSAPDKATATVWDNSEESARSAPTRSFPAQRYLDSPDSSRFSAGTNLDVSPAPNMSIWYLSGTPT